MSDSSSEYAAADSIGDSLDFLEDYEEEILQTRERLEQVFEKVVKEEAPPRDYVIDYLEFALNSEIDSDDSRTVGRHLLHIITNPSTDQRQYILSQGYSEEFADLIFHLTLEYGADSQVPSYKYNQGRNFWSHVTTDHVIRSNSGKVGLNHVLKIGEKDEEIEITTSLGSNLALANHLIRTNITSIERLDEKAIRDTPVDALKTLRERTNQLLEQYEEGIEE